MSTPEEEQRIANAVDRLDEKFPDIPREHIAEIVDHARERLDDATVRDYLPVIVEHDARQELRAESAGSEDDEAGTHPER